MIKAKLSNGALVLGIERRNVQKMRFGQPIHIHGAEIGGFGGVTEVYIIYGETLKDVYGQLEEVFPELPPFQQPKRQEN